VRGLLFTLSALTLSSACYGEQQKISQSAIDGAVVELALINPEVIADCVALSHWAAVRNYNDVNALNDNSVMLTMQSVWFNAYLLNTGKDMILKDVVNASNLQNLPESDPSFKSSWSKVLSYCSLTFTEAYNGSLRAIKAEEASK